jgi:hypothetical protein
VLNTESAIGVGPRRRRPHRTPDQNDAGSSHETPGYRRVRASRQVFGVDTDRPIREHYRRLGVGYRSPASAPGGPVDQACSSIRPRAGVPGYPPRGSWTRVVGRLHEDERVRPLTPGLIGVPDVRDSGGPHRAPTRSRARRAEAATQAPLASEPLDPALSVALRIVGHPGRVLGQGVEFHQPVISS